MTRYLSLLTFTDQGMAQVQHSPERAAAFRASVEGAGGKVIFQYWAIGEFDGCVVFEAPDAATAAAQLIALGKLGNVRTRTLQVFDEHEFSQVTAKV